MHPSYPRVTPGSHHSAAASGEGPDAGTARAAAAAVAVVSRRRPGGTINSGGGGNDNNRLERQRRPLSRRHGGPPISDDGAAAGGGVGGCSALNLTSGTTTSLPRACSSLSFADLGELCGDQEGATDICGGVFLVSGDDCDDVNGSGIGLDLYDLGQVRASCECQLYIQVSLPHLTAGR